MRSLGILSVTVKKCSFFLNRVGHFPLVAYFTINDTIYC